MYVTYATRKMAHLAGIQTKLKEGLGRAWRVEVASGFEGWTWTLRSREIGTIIMVGGRRAPATFKAVLTPGALTSGWVRGEGPTARTAVEDAHMRLKGALSEVEDWIGGAL